MSREDNLGVVLHTLAPAQPVAERLAILEWLITDWHGPCGPGDGYSERELAGLRIPGPLRWWYRLGGKRRGILSGQNVLLGPDALRFADRTRLLVYAENQGVYEWSTLPEGDDPPVWGRRGDRDHPWRPLRLTLSGLLVEACLFESAIVTHCRASASWVDEPTLVRVLAPLTPLPLPSWGYPPRSRFHIGPGTVAFSCPNGRRNDPQGHSLWIGAREGADLTHLEGIANGSWEFLTPRDRPSCPRTPPELDS